MLTRSIGRVVPQLSRFAAASTLTRHSWMRLNASRYFATQTVKVPTLGDSISEGTLISWTKQVGEQVAQDDVIAVIETDKVSVDLRSPHAGKLLKQVAQAEQIVKVGDAIAEIDDAAQGTAAPAAAKAESKAPEAAAAPAASKPAEVQKAAAPAPAPAAAAPKPAAPKPAPLPVGARSERRVPMTRMRQTIANRLKFAQNSAACLTTFQEVDMSALQQMRAQLKDEFATTHQGTKLGFMSAFVAASTAALRKHPLVNASIDGKDIVYRDYVDVSVAVSTPTGLVTPVLRNTEKMSFADIESAIAALGKKARDGKIAIEDLVGGSFTISNGGVFGSLFGTPILNPPQSAILGMHSIVKRPVVVGDQIVIRPMMYLALTYDHRIIDGGDAVTFLKAIKQSIEQPQRLLLGL